MRRAAEVDWASIGALAAEAERLTGIADPTTASVHVSRDQPDPGAEGQRPLTVMVLVQDDYYDGTVVFGLDGEVVWMSGGAPGSEAAQQDS